MKKRDKKQLLPGIVLSVAVGFLVFLYAPIDLYCSNADEFWFDFGILFTAALGLICSLRGCYESGIYCVMADTSCRIPDRTGRWIYCIDLYLCPG